MINGFAARHAGRARADPAVAEDAGRVSTDVRDNRAEHRYEIVVDGEVVGFAAYRVRPDALVMTHTEVLVEGRGLGSQLAKGALDDVRAAHGRVVPLCPFISAFIDKHPEYSDLVAPGTDQPRY